MAITINGSGTITGITAGGLPDGAVTADDLASTLDLSGKTVTLPTVSNLTLSGGVYLGGTGSANYLDDYEEGTWTPVIYIDGSATTTVVTDNTNYTKVGNLVSCQCYIAFQSGTSGGIVDLRGLPFTSSENAYNRGVMTNDYFDDPERYYFYVESSGSVATLRVSGTSQSDGSTNLLGSRLKSSSSLGMYFNFNYRTTS